MTPPNTPHPPDAVMMQMILGQGVTFALGALARLEVADHMSLELQPVELLATKSKVLPDTLYRVLRMLASIGVFTQDGRNFGLTPIGELLRKDAPRSLRNMAIMMTDPWNVHAYMNLNGSIRDGRDGVTHAFGKNAWELFKEDATQLHQFQLAMTDFTVILLDPLMEAYDFSSIHRLADVGGGHGTLIAGLLKRQPKLQGVLFDLPEVVESAKSAGLFAGVEDRIQYQAGSFLESAPAGCDAWIMKHIIHDWDDETCRTILTNIRKQMPANGKVLLFEMVVPDTNEPSPAKMMDIQMLSGTDGGRERTASEFGTLLESAGLKLERIIPTKSPMSVIEGRLG